jgi:CO/xanthine dehydrogenase FAD-binding subunit
MRTVPYERFVQGYRSVDLAPDELLVAVEVPRPGPGTVQHWRKVGTRSAQAITKVAIAAVARVEGGRVVRCRLAFGAVADHPVRLHAVEAMVEGAVADAALAAAVGAAVRDALEPITDVRSTADYRRDVAARLATRFVATL